MVNLCDTKCCENVTVIMLDYGTYIIKNHSKVNYHPSLKMHKKTEPKK